MPLRWSGYRSLRRVYNHVAPPEPSLPRKRESKSIRKALDCRFRGNDAPTVVSSCRNRLRLFIVLVETKC